MDRSFRFCLLLTLGVMIPIVFMMIPLYLRHHVYSTYHLPISTTDERELNHHVSTIWCESERILMNSSFNAYLMSGTPRFENSTRTYWTTKVFELGAEEREYWGFHLPKGSVLTLGMCARYDGAKVFVFKGKRNIKKCTKHEDDDENEEAELSDEDDDYLTDDDFEEVDDDESSVSSSEEDFDKECHGAVFNQTLTFSPSECLNATHWMPKDVLSYVVPETNYYYMLVSSLNEVYPNVIISNITLTKSIYDVSGAKDHCTNKTDCKFEFSFNSDEHVILEMPEKDEWVVDVAEVACEPRTMLYFPFYLMVPISILFFAFRGSK